MTVSDPARAWHHVDAPFTPPREWEPIPGTCSRCGQPAWLGERRWWHQGPACPSRGQAADFIPSWTRQGETP